MRSAPTALLVASVLAALSGCGGESAEVRRLGSPVAQERFEAVLWLAEYGSEAANEALIDSLGDEDPSVRWAAFQGLRQRTGETFGYRPGDPELSRLEAVECWRRWWEEAQGDRASKAVRPQGDGSAGEPGRARGGGEEGPGGE